MKPFLPIIIVSGASLCKRGAQRWGRILFSNVSLLIALISIISCAEADTTYYRGARVNFSYSYTNTIPELNSALGSYGEFCTIRSDGSNFIFTGLKGSTTRPFTAIETRVHPALGLSGLIVGLPNIPELGADQPRVMAFDLSCPCYEEFDTTRNLTLFAGGQASCTRCGRTYDLNNLGIVIKGSSGRNLYRYHASYNQFGNSLTISN